MFSKTTVQDLAQFLLSSMVLMNLLNVRLQYLGFQFQN